jgi:hypothetical protein
MSVTIKGSGSISGTSGGPFTGSTGAPWNLPYPESADEFGVDAIKDLAEAAATGLSGIPVLAGIGSNVVQSTSTSTFTSSSTTYVDITNLEVTITPSTLTSRIFVASFLTITNRDAGQAVGIRLMRESTSVLEASGGSRTPSTVGHSVHDGSNGPIPASIVFVDSPGTTSPVTYKIQGRVGGSGFFYVGRASADTDSSTKTRSAAAIIAMEVAP